MDKMDIKSYLNLELTIAKTQVNALRQAFESEEILTEAYNTQMILLNSKIKVIQSELKVRYPGNCDTHVDDVRIPFNGC